MKMVDNWKTLHKSYTIVLSVLGVILSLVEIVLPNMGLIQPFLDPMTYGFIMFGLSVAVGVGRYIKQDLESKEMKDDKHVH